MPRDFFAPRVTFTYPKRESQTVGPQPKLRVDLNDGDISELQVDFETAEFKLDGQQILPFCNLRSKLDTTAKLGPKRIFEKSNLTYRPSTPLASGFHTLSIQVSDYGGRRTDRTISFRVESRSHDDEERESDAEAERDD